jgi:hypothetical protein
MSRPIRRPWKRIRSAKATAAQDRLIALVERGIAAVVVEALIGIGRAPASAGPRRLAPLRARPALGVSVGEQQSHYCDTEQNKTDRAHAVLPVLSFPPPTLCERRHRSLARRRVAVGRRAIFVIFEGQRPHPRRANWPRIGLEDAANDNAIGEHVEVVIVPLA